MNKKPMSSVFLGGIIFFVFLFIMVEVVFILDNEIPTNVKFFCSVIFLSIVIIGLIVFIRDFVLRKKIQNNQM